MKLNIKYLQILLFSFQYCDVGLGTSGRDHCKNYTPIAWENSKTSRATEFRDCIVMLILFSQTLFIDKNQETFDLFAIDCALKFRNLKNVTMKVHYRIHYHLNNKLNNKLRIKAT